jgi:hypothetical protein
LQNAGEPSLADVSDRPKKGNMFTDPAPSNPDHSLLQAIAAELDAASLQSQDHACNRCGKTTGFVTASFWIYETERSWNVTLPICECELPANTSPSTPPI